MEGLMKILLIMVFLVSCSTPEKEKSSVVKEKKVNDSIQKKKKQVVVKKKEKKVSRFEKYKKITELVNNGREAEVLRESSRLLEKNKNDVYVLNALSIYYYRQGKFDMSKTFLQRAFSVSEGKSVLYNNLAIILNAEEKKEESNSSFKKVLNKTGKNNLSLENAAFFYLENRDFERSYKIYEQRVRAKGMTLPLASNYAFSLWQAGKKEKARKIFKKIYLRANKSELLFNYLLFLYHEDKKYTEARNVISKMEKLGISSAIKPRFGILKKQILRRAK